MPLPKLTAALRVISDPELKFAQSGTQIASFRGVADKKRKNEATGQWEDDKVIFIRVTAFKKLAEHVAASVQKGHTVLVTGEVHNSEWETREGEKRTSTEVIADEIAVSLRWDNAQVIKDDQKGAAPAQTQTNPWAQADNGNADDKPPF